MYKDLNKFFNPKNVAIVGASRNIKKVGNAVLRNIINSNYKGDIYLVNPYAESIYNIKCYKKYTELPIVPDLCLITVNANIVYDVLLDIARKGTKNVVIFSGGFREVGVDGRKLEEKIREICKSYGINILGPNCLGFVSYEASLNATFGYSEVSYGNLRFISQSGAIATSFFDYASYCGINFSDFVTLGNKIDINENDILRYWNHLDKEKNFLNNYYNSKLSLYKPVGVYLESFSDGIGFIDIAGQITMNNPVFILKPGKGKTTKEAMLSHTGSIADDDLLLDSIFKQNGIIRCRSILEFFDLAKSFAWENPPEGNEIAIVTNAGGPAVAALDFLEVANLKLSKLTYKVKNKLSNLYPGRIVNNPIDILGDADSIRYAEVLDILLQEENIFAILVILTPQLMTEIYQTANLISELSSKYKKPIFCSFMGGTHILDAEKILNYNKIPNYHYPENAVLAIGKMWEWNKHRIKRYFELERNKSLHLFQELEDFNLDNINDIFASVSKDKRFLADPEKNYFVLNALQSESILRELNVEIPNSSLVLSIEDALEFTKLNKYPVVLKLILTNQTHKTDYNGVILNIDSDKKLKKSFLKLLDLGRNLDPDNYSILIQKQVQEGLELILGVRRDDNFGHFMILGMGGIYAELIGNFIIVPFPLDRYGVLDAIKNSNVYQILNGYRNQKKYSINKIALLIENLSNLIRYFPNIKEFEINPLIINNKNVYAIDARLVFSKY